MNQGSLTRTGEATTLTASFVGPGDTNKTEFSHGIGKILGKQE